MAKKAITKARPTVPLKRDTSSRFVQSMYRLCIHPLFDGVLLGCIILNTAVMAIIWPDMADDLVLYLEWINNVFTLIFFGEMIIKWIGLGMREYFRDNFNKFDCVIVVISMFDLTITLIVGEGSDFASSLSSFRVFRVLRIFRLFNKIESLRTVTATVAQAVSEVSVLCVIPFLLVFMFGTLGLSVFAPVYATIDEWTLAARHTFKTIGLSMITVFQVWLTCFMCELVCSSCFSFNFKSFVENEE